MEIREHAMRGRGVFATAPRRAHTTLVRALPFALVPNDDAMLRHCCVCLRATDADACVSCNHAVLCTRCQSSPHARLVHEDECPALVALFASSERPRSTRSLRLLLRLLCARWRAECCPPDEQYVADGEWWGHGDVAADELDDIWALCEPPEDAPTARSELHSCAEGAEVPAQLWGALLEMAKQARFFLPSRMRTGLDACADLMGRACSNSLTLYADAEATEAGAREDAHARRHGRGVGRDVRGGGGGMPAEVGVGVSASVAMFNHDCDPNCEWSLDAEGCLVVTNVRPVHAGDEFCLSYVDPRLPASTRQARLREAFFFTCECRACLAGVSRWSCALCGEPNNGPFAETCRCGARRDSAAAPAVRSERRGRKGGPSGKRARVA